MNLSSTLGLVGAYARGRRIDHLRDRQQILSLQHQWFARLRRQVCARSAFYREFADQPLHEWPIIDKAVWMGRFDDINTVGAKLRQLMAIALEAEQTRDFSSEWQGFTVGLSTGTSGHRGLFLVSQRERAQWAGALLAKLLRGGVLSRERVVLVLRAGSTLYDRISAFRLRFHFVDQARPWKAIVGQLRTLSPSILVAPARVLRLLADSDHGLRPTRVISAAEVLDDIDRKRIESAFQVPVEQIYQATEGLLGVTCEQGIVHLNEPYVLIEPQWIDAARTRFVPVVTDLWRMSQPVIRYRMNDVLRARAPCPCGRASLAVAAIEGRMDDVLWLDGAQAAVAIFPDLLSRLIIGALPNVADYEVVERARGSWRIGANPMPSEEEKIRVVRECALMAQRLDAKAPLIEWASLSATPIRHKQRRVRGAGPSACAS